MARSKSSKRWLKEHFEDKYVNKAKHEGLRSRAAYKLQEINNRDRLLKPGMTLIDLGAAPGGWSQFAANVVGQKGKVIALDILSMDAIKDVDFLQGDFSEPIIVERLLKLVGDRPVSLVLSDMAPNITGISSVDQARMMHLAELALELTKAVLLPGGDLMIKLFQGSGVDEFKKELKCSFNKILIRKPTASRARSREIYLLARDYNV
ncbi:MAG: 23S rRNA (uridine(2552)-2'-O)-methyltransferase RlmE [Gammaproteobacteria bacterium]|nr:23S rRNA (uridine(2552)-2'-O)-methyltransferase RlmE [Gammaproteobacteria bacterium]